MAYISTYDHVIYNQVNYGVVRCVCSSGLQTLALKKKVQRQQHFETLRGLNRFMRLLNCEMK
jgi:hypothetical protein